MVYLYILKSRSFPRHYIGITTDVEVRLYKLNHQEVTSTKAYAPWTVLHVEGYNSKTEARRREIGLKRHAGKRKELFDQLENDHHGPIV